MHRPKGIDGKEIIADIQEAKFAGGLNSEKISIGFK